MNIRNAILPLAVIATVGASFTPTTTGTWTLYPGQSTLYTSAIQQPINADGSSVFNANRGVIPIKFALFSQPGPVVFQSIGSDVDTDNDFSFLSFTPSTPMTVADIETLMTVGAYNIGDNHGGSLRWSIRVSPTQSIFVYHGDSPDFGNTTFDPDIKTGQNLLGNPAELRVDSTQLGGPFYGSWSQVLADYGTLNVVRVSLVVDSGWGGDQDLTISSATVNDNTWVPETGGPTPISDLPDAEIMITKTAGAGPGAINEPLSIQSSDNDGMFRKVDSKYMYNLDVRSLLGPGTYEVRVVIDGVPASGPAIFKLK